MMALSHGIKLSNESRNGAQTAQKSKLYTCHNSITILGIHLHQTDQRIQNLNNIHTASNYDYAM